MQKPWTYIENIKAEGLIYLSLKEKDPFARDVCTSWITAGEQLRSPKGAFQ